jgi:hypothetical protein
VRRKFGTKMEKGRGRWAKLRNLEAENFYCSSDMIILIKWSGHERNKNTVLSLNLKSNVHVGGRV